jgi:hypothetical protein
LNTINPFAAQSPEYSPLKTSSPYQEIHISSIFSNLSIASAIQNKFQHFAMKTVNYSCKDRRLSTTNEGGQWARMPICFFFSTHSIALLLLPADIPFLM